MAEVIALAGAVASISQIVAYANKTGSYVSDIVRKVHSAPVTLRNLYKEISFIQSLTKSLEASQVSDEYQWLVQACAQESQALINILENWQLDKNVIDVPKRDRFLLGVKWKCRERRIKEHLENLGRYQTSLILGRDANTPFCQAVSASRPVSCVFALLAAADFWITLTKSPDSNSFLLLLI